MLNSDLNKMFTSPSQEESLRQKERSQKPKIIIPDEPVDQSLLENAFIYKAPIEEHSGIKHNCSSAFFFFTSKLRSFFNWH